MKCKHIDWRQWYRWDTVRESNIVSHICQTCGAWLSLGPSNDDSAEVRMDMALAELLAETECFWEPCGAKDEQFELYVDIFATDDPPNPNLRKPGPRSPIEMMVDRACGIATHDDEGEL